MFDAYIAVAVTNSYVRRRPDERKSIFSFVVYYGFELLLTLLESLIFVELLLKLMLSLDLTPD